MSPELDLEGSKPVFLRDTLAYINAPIYKFGHRRLSGS